MSTTPFVRDGRVRVVVATTVLLSFISFWRAAAIVLNDLGSTAFYVGGIVEQAVGKAAPWFILAVMLFSYAVRAVYVESSAMFVRGGVYRVVKEAMGGTLAKLSVSALLFDYVLTGPISGVSAGQYIVGLLNDLLHRYGSARSLPVGATAAFVAVLITVYFWWRNTQGIHESSDDALRIMKITTVMVVLMIAWCGLTLLWRGGGPLPPAPVPKNLKFSGDALGWLKGTVWPSFTAVAILIGFGHSILAMSGEESLAQVYREIEHPKVKNLQRTGMVIFVYSLLFTSLVSFFAIAIIPDSVRPKFYDNLISGLAMSVVGPLWARLLFQSFVVIVGFLILAGAVNTAIVGSNGVLNRVSEDGVLTDWFRRPQRRYGTTYRLINLVVVLQLVTIVLSRGDVYVLGEAYAFGVVWSFAFKALAMFVLRYKEPTATREWKVPLNPIVGGRELPVGLGLITIVLFGAAAINLFTKQTATISGVAFTLLLYGLFVTSERTMQRRRQSQHAEHTDQFQLTTEAEFGLDQLKARPGCVLVPVRDYNTLRHLDAVVRSTDSSDRDIVVLTIRLLQGPERSSAAFDGDELFTDYEQQLFTRVVAIAERYGRSVKLLVVPASNVFDAVAYAALRLRATAVVVGRSAKMSAADQALALGDAWERLPGAAEATTEFVVLAGDGQQQSYWLGAHAPHLTADDVGRIHRVWLDAVKDLGPRLHHRDVVAVAVAQLESALSGERRHETLNTLRNHIALVALALFCSAAAAHAQDAPAAPKKAEPFAFADFTWLTGSPRTRESPLDTKAFTGEFRVDTNFTYSFNHPQDDTIVGSSEVFRSGEFQLTQLGVGGDFHFDNVRGRLMTQFGMYAQTTPRNDSSPTRGQWDLDTAYRYLSEAYGGYHFDALNGVNVDAGIFMSYVGLWSYYQFDNWTYQPSYVSSNTPWFFNGLRIQIFPTDKLKIEPWVINGWQSYGKFNHAPGVGGQVLWRPNGSLSILANNYWGTDTLGNPDRKRLHTDDSVQVKYFDRPDAPIGKAAFTFTFDAGCETGGGVTCAGQHFIGFMAYHRSWFDRDRYALTVGGGAIDNPGRYLVLLPPINGATAASGTPYFSESPGDPYSAWDTQITFDFMPSQFVTFRSEFTYRHASVPYFAGPGGVTPPGGNTGPPGSLVPGWAPDLRNAEKRVTLALLVKL